MKTMFSFEMECIARCIVAGWMESVQLVLVRCKAVSRCFSCWLRYV